MFRKNSTSKIEGIIKKVKGVEANDLYEIELATTKDSIHIISNKKEHKIYSYEKLSMLYVDRDHICLAFGNIKYMIWVQNSTIDLYELEKEIRESVKNAKLNKNTELQGVAEKVEKKERRSYRKQLSVLLIIVALVCCLCTVGYVFTTQKGKEIFDYAMNTVSEIFNKESENKENEKIQFLETSYEQLTKTKYDVGELRNLITVISTGNNEYDTWLSRLAEIKISFKNNKLTSFKFDKNYSTMADNELKNESEKIYTKFESLCDTLEQYLHDKNDKLSDYILLEDDIEVINNDIFALHTAIVVEIQQLENSVQK